MSSGSTPAAGAFVATGAGPAAWPWLVGGSVAGLLLSAWTWRHRRLAATGALLCLVTGAAVAGLRVVSLHAGPIDDWAADAAVVTQRIADLHAEHLVVGTLLERIRAANVIEPHVDDVACAAERALHRELALLEHGRAIEQAPGICI